MAKEMKKILILPIAIVCLLGSSSASLATSKQWNVKCGTNRFIFDLQYNYAIHYLQSFPIARGKIIKKGRSNTSSISTDFALAEFGERLYRVGINLGDRGPFLYVNKDKRSYTICHPQLLS